MADLVPLFPLNVVLLPGMPLPLHIFEARYRQLVADVSVPGAQRSFGVVAGQPGGVPLADVGTMAEILENEPYADGRCDLLTVGSRRFRIVDLDPDSRPYLRAEVEWLPETDGDLEPALLPTARSLCARYTRALSRLGGREPEDAISDDVVRASYGIAARLRLSGPDRQSLLGAPTAAARLREEVEMMRREITLLEVIRAVPVPPAVLQIVPSVS